MNVEQAIRDYLPHIIHMSLATCAGNHPWICEVHYVFDEELNLYFRSKPSRRHSEEIAQNPRVAGNMVTQHAPGDKVRGVYFEGRAELLDIVDERHPAYTLYCDRFGTGPAILDDARLSDGHKFYKITVERFSLFDGRESNPGQKYDLPWKS